MPEVELKPHQERALDLLRNGNILYGGVGSGKSRTALAYYMKYEAPRDIVVITTAKKRDALDWDREALEFGISRVREYSTAGTLTVDSWNNLGKYLEVTNAFFVFDEQRLVGRGAWVKNFLKIVKNNQWLLLTATPGDSWIDYGPVFIANDFYKNITEFKREHVVYDPFVRFPVISRYLGVSKLERLRGLILVEMPYSSHTERIQNWMMVGYDEQAIADVRKRRWNPFTDEPIKDAAELWRVMRRITNSHSSRLDTVRFLSKLHPRLVVFYNFDYELLILRELYEETYVGEWNGHRKTVVPETDEWVYLVQYTAGSEAWNCTATDAMVLYSLTYSYKNFVQCQGRIDRMDTPYTDLYYYILLSGSIVDRRVKKSLDNKKNFNEAREIRSIGELTLVDG